MRAYARGARTPQGFYPVQSDAFYLELVPDGISKGTRHEDDPAGVGPCQKTAAIGDRENDIADAGTWRTLSAVPKSGDPPTCKKRLILLSIRAKMEL